MPNGTRNVIRHMTTDLGPVKETRKKKIINFQMMKNFNLYVFLNKYMWLIEITALEWAAKYTTCLKKLTLKIASLKVGGDETRSGYMRYFSVILGNVPCTYYVHRDI